ncbi:MAG: hypothetical protein ACD_22C00190G0001 [uncultured bacterium]|nr:MAG: hypothetical protein ACD_22C00190G0001 [uncultured bacterium]
MGRKNNDNRLKNELRMTSITKHFILHKPEARKAIKEQLNFFADLYGVKINRVFIRNQRSRWGSCSKLGNLNFNYKVALLPKELMNYVIVHEVCHLIEFNHSKNFWNQVGKTVPNYKELRKKLRAINLTALIV